MNGVATVPDQSTAHAIVRVRAASIDSGKLGLTLHVRTNAWRVKAVPGALKCEAADGGRPPQPMTSA